MGSDVFNRIRDFKLQGKFAEAWNFGYPVFQGDPKNTYLRTSLFWVCYAAIKTIQDVILSRQNKAPNTSEQQYVNSWINCIGLLNLPVPCEELDFRFFNLFKGCGEHYQSYVQMLSYYGPNLYRVEDLEPFKKEKREFPSLVLRLSRQASKAWLQYHKQWELNLSGILNLLDYALNNCLDSDKTWIHYDISKCLVSAGKYDEAREAALKVLRKKINESWAWGALADTYLNQDEEAAIACYSKGILEAHEPSFCIPMYFSLATLFANRRQFEFASAALCKLIEIYNEKHWRIKPQHEELIQQGWFDASIIESVNLNTVLKTKARDALIYATKKLEIAVGIVDSHHRSGKRFSIYIDINKKLSAHKTVYFGKGLPDVGTWLELKLANDDQRLEVMEAHKIGFQQSDLVQTIHGVLKLNPKGFGFVDDAFIAPYLLDGFVDSEYVQVVKIWDKEPKKGTPNWRVIKINKSLVTNEG